ncbi:hypothetical protein DJ568_03315 [Mucilaginibacter hurinus]|uniref:DUF3298 domain-containing protein n=1 Tax=Mucilaginibacter hurinus TaxID=2201324 RepID=A0A367GRS5_9SPHI|nr:DUF3298 and DUF4163 domain-containing protein [Mucilaginibacter hurinus]RCH55798.1 hypothetical protein DJ568_03315 [Mucilaginibacter hurinus]
MKTAFITLFTALFIFSSCQWGRPPATENGIFTDTLVYEYKTFSKRAADCGEKADSNCTHVMVKYAQFNGQKKLNDSIVAKLLVMFAGEKADTSLDAMATRFIKMYDDDSKDFPSRDMFYTIESQAKVIMQDSSLVTLETSGYTFSGGAHGAAYTGYINWDVRADKQLKLGDILVDNYEAPLTKAGETIFRSNEKLTQDASLATNYFFKDDKFALNDNFLITPLGLKFLYNQYEIKPYAAGQTSLVIPYQQIKNLIRPNAVVSKYVK